MVRPATIQDRLWLLGRKLTANMGLKLVALAIAIAAYVMVHRASTHPAPNAPAPPTCTGTN
jgi:hypothetical protein